MFAASMAGLGIFTTNQGDLLKAPPLWDGIRDVLTPSKITGDITLDAYLWNSDLSNENGVPACELLLRGYRQGTDNRALGVQPMIRVKPGDELNILFRNGLEADPPVTMADHNTYHGANTSNLHTHGLHISSNAPADDILIKVYGGKSYQYRFPIGDKQNQLPGTTWYHAHVHGSTLLQVQTALGFLIVEDDQAEAPQWLLNAPEVYMLVSDLRQSSFTQYKAANADNLYASSATTGCWATANEYYLVNGQYQPRVQINENEWTRFRVAVAGPTRTLSMKIPDNCEAFIIALDGIYVDQPIPVTNTEYTPNGNHIQHFAPGNRRDIMIRCGVPAGDSVFTAPIRSASLAETVCAGTNPPCFLSANRGIVDVTVATLEVVAAGNWARCDPDVPCIMGKVCSAIGYCVDNNDPTTLPWFTSSYLHPPYLADLRVGDPEHYDVAFFSILTGFFMVNGRVFPEDPEKLPEWEYPFKKVTELAITSTANHPYHQHVVPFQIVDENFSNTFSKVYGFTLLGRYFDTFLSVAGSIVMRFKPDILSDIITHCHFLDHEDLGMMALGKVVQTGCQSCCSVGGCNDYDIRECVGKFDAPCKANKWDQQCVEEAKERCGLVC